jgi:hypothetical protein
MSGLRLLTGLLNNMKAKVRTLLNSYAPFNITVQGNTDSKISADLSSPHISVATFQCLTTLVQLPGDVIHVIRGYSKYRRGQFLYEVQCQHRHLQTADNDTYDAQDNIFVYYRRITKQLEVYNWGKLAWKFPMHSCERINLHQNHIIVEDSTGEQSAKTIAIYSLQGKIIGSYVSICDYIGQIFILPERRLFVQKHKTNDHLRYFCEYDVIRPDNTIETSFRVDFTKLSEDRTQKVCLDTSSLNSNLFFLFDGISISQYDMAGNLNSQKPCSIDGIRGLIGPSLYMIDGKLHILYYCRNRHIMCFFDQHGQFVRRVGLDMKYAGHVSSTKVSISGNIIHEYFKSGNIQCFY